MTPLIALFVTLLAPVSIPVSGGGATDFRFMQGLVPVDGWTLVPGLPFSEKGTFSRITYAEGPVRGFRVLSSGPTAGMNPSTGAWVEKDGYAGFLSVEGVTVSVCDYGSYSLAASHAGVTVDYRETGGLHGELRSGLVGLAGGADAFTAGVSPRIAGNLRAGPSWHSDRHGQGPWLQASFSTGGLLLESGGAVAGRQARRRASALFTFRNLQAAGGWDDDNLFGTLSPLPGVRIQWPEWGIHSLVEPWHWAVVQLSHRQGGHFQAEFQGLHRGITGGFLLRRRPEGPWSGGLTIGIHM